jgi:hypothetical protein
MSSKSLDALQKGKGSQSRSPLQHPMICCFFHVKGQYYSCCVKVVDPEPVPVPDGWLLINTAPSYNAGISAQQAQAAEERPRMEVRGSSLLAKDDLPVATSACSLCNGNQERLLAVLRANHPGYQSAAYAIPCQAYSSLALNKKLWFFNLQIHSLLFQPTLLWLKRWTGYTKTGEVLHTTKHKACGEIIHFVCHCGVISPAARAWHIICQCAPKIRPQLNLSTVCWDTLYFFSFPENNSCLSKCC